MNSNIMQPMDHVSYLRDQAVFSSADSGGSYLKVVNFLPKIDVSRFDDERVDSCKQVGKMNGTEVERLTPIYSFNIAG